MPAEFDEKGNIIIPKTMRFNDMGQPLETIYTLQENKARPCGSKNITRSGT